MKTLFTFLAIWILFASLLVYQSDFSRMTMIRWEVGRIAEQSAAGCIQFFDEESYAEGNIVLNEPAMNEHAEDFLAEEIEDNKKLSQGEVKLRLTVFDEMEADGEPQSRLISTKVTYEEDDFFRLSYLNKGSVEREVFYEVKGR